MEVKGAIQKRRALRALSPIEITEEIIEELGKSIQLAPSCANKQPWRYVFVYDKVILNELHESLSGGNYWAKKASMIIAVTGKKENDCVIGDREYYMFDIGMSTGFFLLRATEMGLVAHPMAGFNPNKAKKILNIPEEVNLITLIAVSKQAKNTDGLSENHAISEKNRPSRISLEEIIFRNKFMTK